MTSQVTMNETERDEFNKAVYFGEKAQQKEDNFGSIEVKYKKKDITKFIIDWLEKNRIRTPVIIKELFEDLDEFIDVTEKSAKAREKFEKKQKRVMRSSDKYDGYVNDRRRVFNDIIKDQENRAKGENIPPELDTLVASELVFARKTIMKESKKVREILRAIQIRKRFNVNVRETIAEKVKNVIYSIICIILRDIEISIKARHSSDLGKCIELLNWDINTLQFSRYYLDEYASSLLRKVWKKEWKEGFTEETRELIRLFTD